jgi:hypothetical protein
MQLTSLAKFTRCKLSCCARPSVIHENDVNQHSVDKDIVRSGYCDRGVLSANFKRILSGDGSTPRQWAEGRTDTRTDSTHTAILHIVFVAFRSSDEGSSDEGYEVLMILFSCLVLPV